jgi:hypothetical protein
VLAGTSCQGPAGVSALCSRSRLVPLNAEGITSNRMQIAYSVLFMKPPFVKVMNDN